MCSQKNAIIPLEFSQEYEFSDVEEGLSDGDSDENDKRANNGSLLASGGSLAVSNVVLPDDVRDALDPAVRAQFEAALRLDKKDLVITKALKQVATTAQKSTVINKAKAGRVSVPTARQSTVEDARPVQVLTTMGRGILEGAPDVNGIQKVLLNVS